MNLNRIAQDMERSGYSPEEIEDTVDRLAQEAIDNAKDREVEERMEAKA